MAKKKKEEEHVNLERWMVSYSDFVTLLFATFVVLYALSQVDIKGFQEAQDSIKGAFAAPSLIQGASGVLDKNGGNSVLDTSQGNSVVAPLMMEYVSPKYENDSMKEIKKEINEETKSGDLNGIQAIETERGLLIRFNNDLFFQPNSATLSENAKRSLDKVGLMICKKFVLHNMRVEGHTDNLQAHSSIYPSNWELSSARSSSVIRYLILRFKFMPTLFSAVGFADTRPLVPNTTAVNMAKNRRVDILLLKNKYKSQENAADINKLTKAAQDKLQQDRLAAIDSVGGVSDAAKKLAKGDKRAVSTTVILNNAYDSEAKRLNDQTRVLDAPAREKANGGDAWLKPPAASGVKVFKGK